MGTPTPGPGKFSKRTDKTVSEANRDLPNAGYGEQAAYQEQMQAAPMASAPPAGASFVDLFGDPSSSVVGFDSESTRPDEPVTAGAPLGPGPGAESLGLPQDATIDRLRAYLPALQYMADNGNSDAARNIVRKIQAMTM